MVFRTSVAPTEDDYDRLIERAEAAESDESTELVEYPLEGWRAFLVSWKMAAILLAGCVLGLLAILSASSFGSPSVSEQVSDAVGRSASCTPLAVRDDGGGTYRCIIDGGAGEMSTTRCFLVANGTVRQFVDTRRGC